MLSSLSKYPPPLAQRPPLNCDPPGRGLKEPGRWAKGGGYLTLQADKMIYYPTSKTHTDRSRIHINTPFLEHCFPQEKQKAKI